VEVYAIDRRGEQGFTQAATKTLEAPHPVWRVAWNATGTVISTAAENGTVCLWRRNFDGEWTLVQEIAKISEPTRCFYKNV
jgi:hypothetical protein